MVYKLRFRQEVLYDLKNSTDYYRMVSENLSNGFLKEFETLLKRVEENPLQFQIRYRAIRIAHLKRFPYSIHYFVEDDVIFVLRLLHQKQYYQ